MALAIGLIVILIAWVIMPKRIKQLCGLLVVVTIIYGINIKFIQGGMQSFSEFTTLMFLFTAIVGLLIFGMVLGLLKETSSSHASYLEKRDKIISFIVKWGGLYLLITFTFRLCIFLAYGANADAWDLSWIITKVYGTGVFVFCIGAYYYVKSYSKER
ncbi:hypothetical protein EXT46_10990 [Pseudoalteromonas sp. CO325X]|uniref:hypothetical protein n=1 Tax=Pseudoalteromonas sp. CO325X TaxID=1777262 RepID=UPI0010236B91|nr:hypothetical protein [Pseudoalteromonas sp. CO325X]RZF80539.1 hypothetical protein EXT46_10990 [Pseudoalteromonas sp. CO325X]